MMSRDLRFNLKNTLFWLIGVQLLILMYLPTMEMVMEQMEDLKGFLNKLPNILKALANLDEEVFLTPEGYFGTEGMGFMYILSAIFGATMVSRIFSREFSSKTYENLLIKPLSRKRIFLEKLSVVTFYEITYALVFTAGLLLQYSIFIKEPYSTKVLIGFGIYTLIIEFLASAISFLLSLWKSTYQNVMVIMVMFTFLSYFLEAMGRAIQGMKWLSYISIFNYIPTVDLIKTRSYNITGILLLLAAGTGILILAYSIFNKKDLIY